MPPAPLGLYFLSRSVANTELQVKPHLERQDLLDELAAKGIRLTAPRRAFVETIREANLHLDAGSLLELARKRRPKMDCATVYRNYRAAASRLKPN